MSCFSQRSPLRSIPSASASSDRSRSARTLLNARLGNQPNEGLTSSRLDSTDAHTEHILARSRGAVAGESRERSQGPRDSTRRDSIRGGARLLSAPPSSPLTNCADVSRQSALVEDAACRRRTRRALRGTFSFSRRLLCALLCYTSLSSSVRSSSPAARRSRPLCALPSREQKPKRQKGM